MLNQQAPNAIMMVHPYHFGYNEETAGSNAFQQCEGKQNVTEVRAQAKLDFDHCLEALKSAGVDVIDFMPRDQLDTPDAVFPNNWVSFHPDGKVIIYPMMAPSRRLERRMEFITALEMQHNFEISEIIDLSKYELEGRYLEGTGSLVFDYINKVAYANYSPRTDISLMDRTLDILGYTGCHFKAVDNTGQDIYHTNVMMCIGKLFAVVCMDAIEKLEDKKMVQHSLESSGHQLVLISQQQMASFAGNMMEVMGGDHQSVLVMSQNAYNSLHKDQVSTLERYSQLLTVPIDTIEKYGGGSVRCMMAGVYLVKDMS